MGWPKALEGNCTKAWDTIFTLSKKWEWIKNIFGDSEEYQSALCAYYMALNVYEYIDVLGSRNKQSLIDGSLHLEIPLDFYSSDDDIKLRAYRLLTNEASKIVTIWRDAGIDDAIAIKHWKNWIEVCIKWLNGVYSYRFVGMDLHENLLEKLVQEANH